YLPQLRRHPGGMLAEAGARQRAGLSADDAHRPTTLRGVCPACPAAFPRESHLLRELAEPQPQRLVVAPSERGGIRRPAASGLRDFSVGQSSLPHPSEAPLRLADQLRVAATTPRLDRGAASHPQR